MKEHFSELLESLRRQLIGMGAEVENQIRLAMEALVDADATKARRVIDHDNVIDELEVKNEEEAIHLLATQQPVASDLRLLVSSLKINSGLERIVVERTQELENKVAELDEKNAELRESDQRFRTLADQGLALIWTAGTDKLCDYFNQPWLNFTGRTLERILKEENRLAELAQ